VSGVLKSTLAKRLQGERPSPLQASLAAAAAGVAAAVVTYRVVRS
jgi:uncharacterized OsmC-like protein